MKFISFVLFQSLVYSCLYAQEVESLDPWLKKADSLFKSGQFEKSVQTYEQASTNFLEKGDINNYIKSVNKISEILIYDLDNYHEALLRQKMLLDGKYSSPSLFRSYTLAAKAHSRLDQHDSAIMVINRAIESFDFDTDASRRELSSYYNTLSIENWYLGDFDLAADFQKKNQEVLRSFPEPNEKKLANSYSNVGLILWKQWKLQEALEYFFHAVRSYENLGVSRNLINTYSNIGAVYGSLDQEYDAIKYFRLALNIDPEKVSKSSESSIWQNLGNRYSEIGAYDSALICLNKSLTMRLDIYGDDHTEVARTFLNIGLAHFANEEYKLALDYYEKALAIRIKKLGNNHSDVISNYNYLAQLYLETREHSLAIDMINMAKNGNRVSSEQQEENLRDQVLYPELFLETLMLETDLLAQQGSEAQAEIALAELIKLYDELIFFSDSDRDKYFYREREEEIYQKIIEMKLSRRSSESNMEAFYLTESSKSKILIEKMRKGSLSFELPLDLRKEEKELKQNIERCRSKLLSANRESASKDSIDFLLNRMFEYKTQLKYFAEEVKSSLPEYYKLNYGNPLISVEDIRETILQENQIIIEYHVSSNQIYVFVIGSDFVEVVELDLPKNLEILIQDYRKLISIGGMAEFATASFELYKVIFEDALKKVPGHYDRLLIIPDGYLWHVNFDHLLMKEYNDQDSYKSLDYVVNHYAISYAYSVNSAKMSLERDHADNNDMLALSYSKVINDHGNKIGMSSLRNSNLNDLPGAAKEIQAIAQKFDGQYLYGNMATETIFKEQAKNYRFIHLAVHGEIFHKDSRNTRLIFKDGKDDSNDGNLYPHEISNLDLACDLIFLSACHSASGDIKHGEGVIGLSSALVQAGCRSAVLSQWELNDAITPSLVSKFYSLIDNNVPKDKALQEAKLTYLNESSDLTSNPKYWGSLILVGDVKPISNEDNYRLWIFVSIFFLVILFGFIHFSNRN